VGDNQYTYGRSNETKNSLFTIYVPCTCQTNRCTNDGTTNPGTTGAGSHNRWYPLPYELPDGERYWHIQSFQWLPAPYNRLLLIGRAGVWSHPLKQISTIITPAPPPSLPTSSSGNATTSSTSTPSSPSPKVVPSANVDDTEDDIWLYHGSAPTGGVGIYGNTTRTSWPIPVGGFSFHASSLVD
jgi:hypothetical protein